MGRTKPRDARKLEPCPPPARAPGKATGVKGGAKKYSFFYQRRSKLNLTTGRRFGGWRTVINEQWYETARQRDDAMRAAGGMWRSVCEIRRVTPIMLG
jgi:hypothetical protein